MYGEKSAAGSITIVSASVVILAQLAALAGYTLSPDDQAALSNLITSGVQITVTIVSLIGAAGAIWGRVRATKEITSVIPK